VLSTSIAGFVFNSAVIRRRVWLGVERVVARLRSLHVSISNRRNELPKDISADVLFKPQHSIKTRLRNPNTEGPKKLRSSSSGLSVVKPLSATCEDGETGFDPADTAKVREPPLPLAMTNQFVGTYWIPNGSPHSWPWRWRCRSNLRPHTVSD